MSAAAREMEAKIARIICDAGGRLTQKGVDGAGHRMICYEINGHGGEFHYAHTPQGNGCGPLNTYTRLRRDVRSILTLPPIVIASESPKEAPQTLPGHLTAPPARATPQKAQQPTRSDLIKRYLSVRSIRAVAEELGFERDKAQRLILSSRGDAATLLRRELDAERAEAARRLRPNKPNPALADPKKRSRLAALAHRLYFGKNRTAADTARIVGVSVSTALKLAQEGDA